MIIQLKKENSIEIKVIFQKNAFKNKEIMKQISGVKWHSNHWYITFNKISIERLAELYKDAEIYPDEYIKYFFKN